MLGVGRQGFRVSEAPNHGQPGPSGQLRPVCQGAKKVSQEGRAGQGAPELQGADCGAQSHQLQPAASITRQEGDTMSLFTGLPSTLPVQQPALEGQRALGSLSRRTSARKKGQGPVLPALPLGCAYRVTLGPGPPVLSS